MKIDTCGTLVAGGVATIQTQATDTCKAARVSLKRNVYPGTAVEGKSPGCGISWEVRES